MVREKFLDLVITGPDMSGTSTQIDGIIKYFQSKGLIVKDLRGTEIDVLFHSEKIQSKLEEGLQNIFVNFKDFLDYVKKDNPTSTIGRDILYTANSLLSGTGTNQDLKIASMVKNDVTTYIDPNFADVWVMEEPTKRDSGQTNRVIEQNRSAFGWEMNPKAAAESHSIYRTSEFLRFRKPLREEGKVIVRSRSEESSAYQCFNWFSLKDGVSKKYYLQLEGNRIAFANPPTNIFVVCGPENWTVKDYLKLKKERSERRYIDDYEKNARYQVFVNKRYATNWLEKFYEKGTKKYGARTPEITRFNIYDSKEEIIEKMKNKLEKILN